MKRGRIPYNELLNREVEKNAPPTSYDITPRKQGRWRNYEVTFYARRLLLRLLTIADLDYTIPLPDREILELSLKGRSNAEIAAGRNVTPETIRNRINVALEVIDQKIDFWENANHLLCELREKISQEQEQSQLKDQQIEELTRKVSLYEPHDIQIRAFLKEYEERMIAYNPAITRPDESAKMVLDLTLKELGLPPHIVKKLASHDIYTVLDLVCQSEDDLYQLLDNSDKGVKVLKKKMNRYGLELGTEIRRVPGTNDYIVFPPPEHDLLQNLQEQQKLMRAQVESLKALLDEQRKSEEKKQAEMQQVIDALHLNTSNSPDETGSILKGIIKSQEKDIVRKDNEISKLKIDVEGLKTKNAELRETVKLYRQQLKEEKRLKNQLKREKRGDQKEEQLEEESRLVKKLKSRNESLENLFEQMREQGRITVASLDFLEDKQ